MKCFSCGRPNYASRCPETTQQQKDELYSEAAKAKRAALRTKKGVNQLTTEGSGSGAKESAKAAAAAKSTSGASSAALTGALGGFSAEHIKQAVELLMVLDMGDAKLDEGGVGGMLLQTFPEGPQQMAGVALLATRIFPMKNIQ